MPVSKPSMTPIQMPGAKPGQPSITGGLAAAGGSPAGSPAAGRPAGLNMPSKAPATPAGVQQSPYAGVAAKPESAIARVRQNNAQKLQQYAQGTASPLSHSPGAASAYDHARSPEQQQRFASRFMREQGPGSPQAPVGAAAGYRSGGEGYGRPVGSMRDSLALMNNPDRWRPGASQLSQRDRALIRSGDSLTRNKYVKPEESVAAMQRDYAGYMNHQEAKRQAVLEGRPEGSDYAARTEATRGVPGEQYAPRTMSPAAQRANDRMRQSIARIEAAKRQTPSGLPAGGQPSEMPASPPTSPAADPALANSKLMTVPGVVKTTPEEAKGLRQMLADAPQDRFARKFPSFSDFTRQRLSPDSMRQSINELRASIGGPPLRSGATSTAAPKPSQNHGVELPISIGGGGPSPTINLPPTSPPFLPSPPSPVAAAPTRPAPPPRPQHPPETPTIPGIPNLPDDPTAYMREVAQFRNKFNPQSAPPATAARPAPAPVVEESLEPALSADYEMPAFRHPLSILGDPSDEGGMPGQQTAADSTIPLSILGDSRTPESLEPELAQGPLTPSPMARPPHYRTELDKASSVKLRAELGDFAYGYVREMVRRGFGKEAILKGARAASNQTAGLKEALASVEGVLEKEAFLPAIAGGISKIPTAVKGVGRLGKRIGMFGAEKLKRFFSHLPSRAIDPIRRGARTAEIKAYKARQLNPRGWQSLLHQAGQPARGYLVGSGVGYGVDTATGLAGHDTDFTSTLGMAGGLSRLPFARQMLSKIPAGGTAGRALRAVRRPFRMNPKNYLTRGRVSSGLAGLGAVGSMAHFAGVPKNIPGAISQGMRQSTADGLAQEFGFSNIDELRASPIGQFLVGQSQGGGLMGGVKSVWSSLPAEQRQMLTLGGLGLGAAGMAGAAGAPALATAGLLGGGAAAGRALVNQPGSVASIVKGLPPSTLQSAADQIGQVGARTGNSRWFDGLPESLKADVLKRMLGQSELARASG